MFLVYRKPTDAWRRPDVCLSNLFVGSNFKNISMFSKFLQLPILSQTTFSKIQRTYLVPSIDQYWVEHQDGILKLLIGKYVIFSVSMLQFLIKQGYDVSAHEQNST